MNQTIKWHIKLIMPFSKIKQTNKSDPLEFNLIDWLNDLINLFDEYIL